MINLINLNAMYALQKMSTTYIQVALLKKNVNAHYLRIECLDIVAIPSKAKDKTLKESVGNFDELGCSVAADRIEACHRVSKNNKTVIVKFNRRKSCQRFWNKKKKLPNHKMEDFGLSGQENKYLSTVAYALIMSMNSI